MKKRENKKNLIFLLFGWLEVKSEKMEKVNLYKFTHVPFLKMMSKGNIQRKKRKKKKRKKKEATQEEGKEMCQK